MVAIEPRIFVDTDILIDIARKDSRALDFWRRAETRSTMTCSVISVFELLGGCRNLREQRATLRSLTTVELSKSRAEILVRRYSGIGPIIFPEASVFLTVLWQSPPDVWIAKSTHGTQSISEPFPA